MKELKNRMKKENKGITLLALVITIIVLLILAGVSIAMLTGENGILTQAQRAKTETENAARQEEEDLAKLEAMVNGQDVPIIQVDDKNPGQLEQEDETTFVINSIEDLVFFSYDVTNNGNKYENQTVKLGTNLDFSSDKSYVDQNRENYYGYSGKLKEALTSGNGFQPIGELSKTGTKYFYGTFDGNNNAICSLYINIDRNENVRVGLFSSCYGKIENLGVVNTNILVKGLETSVGALVGSSYNNIYNSYATGNINVTGSSWVINGGICGTMYNGGDIINSYNLANIEGKNISETSQNADVVCGGIVGQAEGEGANIEKCFNQGNITANGGNTQVYAGGIAGSITSNGSNCIVRNCYNKAIIQGNTSTNYTSGVGGILGLLRSTDLLYCYNLGDVIGSKEKSTNGNLFGIGGIIGRQGSNSTIDNVFNIGKVTSTNSSTDLRVGGITGVISNNATNVSINNAYNTGSIEANGLGSEQVGSIVGSNLITLSNCFYLKGTYDVGVAGSETVTGVTKWDTIEDFPSVLSVVNGEGAFKEDTEGINNGYPVLDYQ